MVNMLLDGSVLEQHFPNGQVTDFWYYSFRELGSRYGRRNIASNLEQFYTVLQGALLDTGITVSNPEFDSTLEWRKDMPDHLQRKCCPIIITKPERLASTDKTEGTTNQSGGSTMHQDAKNLIWLNRIDHSEVLINKTSTRPLCRAGH